MKEIERILSLLPQDRTESDLDYLEKHKDELTAEQKTQLENEKVEAEKALKEKEEKEAKEKEEAEKAKQKELEEKKFSIDVSTEIKDLGDGEVETVISSNALDRHGERIDVKGIDFSKYKKNNVVMWAHNYDNPPLGNGTKLRVEGNKLIGRIKFFLSEKPVSEQSDWEKFTRTVYEMIKAKVLNAVSIGFIPLEMDGDTFIKSEMVEFSVVPIPANPEALITIRKMGIDMDIFKSYNIRDMGLEAILKKIKEEGKEALTLAEVKFLKEHKDDLSANQIKEYELKDILDPEPTPDPAPTPDPTPDPKPADDETAKKLKELEDKIEKIGDPVKLKRFNGQFDVKRDANGNVSKEMNLLLFVQGLMNKDFSNYENIVGKDAMNTTDDGVLLPLSEFITEVERLEAEYGVARQYANVRRSATGAGVKFLLGDDDLEIFDTAQSGVKKSTKLSYTYKLLTWRKFAGILPLTDELSEDSAIDLWADSTKRFARAFTRKEDVLVFTETSGAGKNPGIVNVVGTHTYLVPGDSFADLDYDTLSKMIWGVPQGSRDNGRFYLNAEILGVVQRIKDLDGRPIWQRAMADGTPATILGKPYTETAVLPALTDDDAETAFIVFGDLKYVTLGERTQLSLKIFDTGNVGDPDEAAESQDDSDINLLTQDVQALRAVKRMNAIVRFPSAFSVAKTAETS